MKVEFAVFHLDEERRALIVAIVVGRAHVRQTVVEIDLLSLLQRAMRRETQARLGSSSIWRVGRAIHAIRFART
jgi:hypothetical protein